jgi:RNA polymerase sigma factor (sigma-70 family)
MVEKAHQFDEARGFLPWAKVVIYRCFVDEWRKEQRKIQTTELEEEITEDYLPAPSIVRDVLVSMGKEHRYLLAALYMHGMTQKELAEELGVSVSYIKRHVDKAKKSFTRYYDEYNHAIGESYC